MDGSTPEKAYQSLTLFQERVKDDFNRFCSSDTDLNRKVLTALAGLVAGSEVTDPKYTTSLLNKFSTGWNDGFGHPQGQPSISQNGSPGVEKRAFLLGKIGARLTKGFFESSLMDLKLLGIGPDDALPFLEAMENAFSEEERKKLKEAEWWIMGITKEGECTPEARAKEAEGRVGEAFLNFNFKEIWEEYCGILRTSLAEELSWLEKILSDKSDKDFSAVAYLWQGIGESIKKEVRGRDWAETGVCFKRTERISYPKT